jgi:hypothetical protein
MKIKVAEWGLQFFLLKKREREEHAQTLQLNCIISFGTLVGLL